MKMKKIISISIVVGMISFIIFLIISCSDFNPWKAGGLGVRGINVKQGSTDIEHGSGVFDFGYSIADGNDGASSIYIPFTIENNLNTEITISEISLSSGNMSDFDLLDNESSSIAPSESTLFSMRFDPIFFGDKSSIVTIVSNDPSGDTYTFTVTGCGSVIKRLGGSGPEGDSGTAVAINDLSCIILSGCVEDTADLNGDGDDEDGKPENDPYGALDFFISYFNPDFSFNWAIRGGGTGDDCIEDIVTNNNSIIVTGKVMGDADLNGDDIISGFPEDVDSMDYYYEDIIIVRYNYEGVLDNATRIGGTGHDFGYGVATMGNTGIIFTGIVQDNVDLNADGDVDDEHEHPDGTKANYDVIICRYDLSLTLQWSERLGGALADGGNAIATDTLNNVYVTGYTTSNVDLDGNGSDETTGYDDKDIFISCFNSSGGFLWSKSLGGPQHDEGTGIAVDSSGNVFVTGYVTSNADLNGDKDMNDMAESGSGYGDSDCFVVCFDSAHNFQWAKRLGAQYADTGTDIIIDMGGNVVVTGKVTGKADLDGDGNSSEGPEIDFYGGNDVFITILDTLGNTLWMERLGGSHADCGNGIAVNKFNDLFVCGDVEEDADLNGDMDYNDNGESSYGYGIYDAFVSTF